MEAQRHPGGQVAGTFDERQRPIRGAKPLDGPAASHGASTVPDMRDRSAPGELPGDFGHNLSHDTQGQLGRSLRADVQSDRRVDGLKPFRLDSLLAKCGVDPLHLPGASDHAYGRCIGPDYRAEGVSVLQVAVSHDDDVRRRADGHEVGRVRGITVDKLVRVGEALRRDHVPARVEDDHLEIEQLPERTQLLPNVAGTHDEKNARGRMNVEEDCRHASAERTQGSVALFAELVRLASGDARRQAREGVRDHLLLEDSPADRLDDAAVGEHQHLRADPPGTGAAHVRDGRQHERNALKREFGDPCVQFCWPHALSLTAS